MKRIVIFALLLFGAYSSKAQLKGEDFSDYHPHGCTPLYDAMGLSLIRLHEKVKGDKEASVVVTVLTDGPAVSVHGCDGEHNKFVHKCKKEQQI